MLTRLLAATTPSGNKDVPIEIQPPTQGDQCWECRYAIGWPEGEQRGIARGYDSMQAIYLAMQRIALKLYGSSYHAAGALVWDKPGNGYGFPMPKSGYEDLVGEDRIAQVPE